MVVAVVGGVLMLLILLLATRNTPVTPPTPALPATRHAEAPRPSMAHEESRPSIAPDPSQRVSASRDTAEGEAPAEHMLRGVIAANGEELGLTPKEVDRLVSETLEFQEIQTELMTRYLQETRYDPTAVSLHVPPFPIEGKALRDMYHQRLRTAFPEGKFEKIQDQVGGYLDEAFRGFGIADQTFTLSRSTEHPGAIELAYEIRVPEGQSPGGPNVGMSYPGASGRMLLTPQQVASGEYRFLAPVVARHFPEIPLKTP